ncbi:hypothetical protein BGW80DRAFT_1435937 [Lactifluus volemus]|nr:hypothetical protein BGW80DRAFT_1435937 [Lactifluus volemus]
MAHALNRLSNFFTRRVFARLLSTFICCLVLVVKPLSRYGGPSAFLLLTLKELVFSAQETLAQHFEATILNITAGWTKSKLPRLQLSARISCFVSIWLLTTDPGVSTSFARAATSFVWITLSPAVICLLCNMLFLRWFSTHFARTLANSFSKLHECLVVSMNENLILDENWEPLGVDLQRNHILDELLADSIQLDLAYSIAAFELRLGRISVESIKPLIGVVENIRRELAWGSSRAILSPGEKSHAVMMPAGQLSQAILASMKYVEAALLFAFERSANVPGLETSGNKTAPQILRRLDEARDAARREFATAFQSMNDGARKDENEMADEMNRAVLVADKILSLHSTSRTRLWYPRFSWAWLGVSDENYSNHLEDGGGLSLAEAREGLSELVRWREAKITRLRFVLAACVRAIVHSSHLQHAVKNSIGVMLLSIPAFLPVGSPGQRWFVDAHGQWMIISYVWVLETNTGATWRVAYLRTAGTIVGAVYAYLTWLICRTNPYGLVLMVTLADLPISWLILGQKFPLLALLRQSVTLPPIVFFRFLDANSDTEIIVLAAWRAAMISAGVLAALVMNTLVFPKHCRMLFLRNASHTLGLLGQLYLALSRDLFKRNRVCIPDDGRRVLMLELEIRNSSIRLSRLMIALRDEMSLLPKPMMQYRNTVTSIQAMLDIMIGLRKIREHIPIRETVFGVMRDRREFVSCVCISLYACDHAFRAHQPLPQFLPSVRHARRTLMLHIAPNLHQSQRAHGLSRVYASAEGEVLLYMVDTLENLLNICRTLFGTAEWLTGPADSEVSTLTDPKIHHEWHGTL